MRIMNDLNSRIYNGLDVRPFYPVLPGASIPKRVSVKLSFWRRLWKSLSR